MAVREGDGRRMDGAYTQHLRRCGGAFGAGK